MNFEQPLLWIDLEMSGLNIEKDVILEIGFVLSDGQLSNLKEGPELILQANQDILDQMDDWNQKHHTQTGLKDACLKSSLKIEEADEIIVNFLKENSVKRKELLQAGNSLVTDRLFINKYLPKLSDYLFYRTIDVSTLKELTKRWAPEVYQNAPQKKLNHRALDDIKESIIEYTSNGELGNFEYQELIYGSKQNTLKDGIQIQQYYYNQLKLKNVLIELRNEWDAINQQKQDIKKRQQKDLQDSLEKSKTQQKV